MMRRLSIWPMNGLILCAAIALVGPAAAQKLPWHATEGDVLGGATRVFLVPPDVHVEKWTIKSGTETTASADYLQRIMCGEMDDLFEQRKIEVRDFFLCLGEGETTHEKRDAVMAVQQRFRDLVTNWSRPIHRGDLLQSFRLVEELEVTRKMEADVLIAITADGSLVSRGEKAISMTGGAQGLMLHIGVIRARTGELLFFSEKFIGGDFLKHPEGLEKAIQKSVQAAFAPQAK